MRALKFSFTLTIAAILLSACGGVTPVPTAAPTSAPTLPPAPTSTPRPEWTTPHPILSDVRVRRAIAYCTDKDALIESVYPYLTPEQRESLVMDSFLPREHWAYAGEENIEIYPFDPQKGMALLDEAEWNLKQNDEIRVNNIGEKLHIGLSGLGGNSTKSWNITWIEQMKTCGIEIIQTEGDGIYHGERGPWDREFELKITQKNAWMNSRYFACDEIPLQKNGWGGWNLIGWCNSIVDRNISIVENTLIREEQIEPYKKIQQEFTKDAASLPLYLRPYFYAINPNLKGVDLLPGGGLYTRNIAKWEIPGKDTIKIGMWGEPQTLFRIVEDQNATTIVSSLIEGQSYFFANYDIYPSMQNKLSTIENGLAVNETVTLNEGDRVLGDAYGEWRNNIELKPGVKYWDANGELVEYKGGPITTKQLTVKYEFVDGLTWSDGVPVSKDDFALFYKIAIDPESGSCGYGMGYCFINDYIQKIDFADNGYTITWIAGSQLSDYALAPLGFYPAHRILSDGRLLADLPAKEWATTPEVTHNPIGAGPYVLKEWIPGDRMVFEANSYYYGETPKTKTIVIKFLSHATGEASLILGYIDFLDWTYWRGLSDALLAAEQEGLIRIVVVPSSTWERIDMNLYIK